MINLFQSSIFMMPYMISIILESKMVSDNEAVSNWRDLAPSVLDNKNVFYELIFWYVSCLELK